MKISQQTALLIRMPIAMSFVGHGIARLPRLEAFISGMNATFENTYIPASIISCVSFVLPFFELLIGLLLAFGFKLKYTTAVAIGMMCILIIGASLIENWQAVAIQMFYGLYLAIIHFLESASNPSDESSGTCK